MRENTQFEYTVVTSSSAICIFNANSPPQSTALRCTANAVVMIQLLLGIVVLLPVHEGDGVENEVVVQVVPIQHLKAIAPEMLRGLHADLMAFLRRDLAGLEALIAVPGDVSAGLVILLLGQLHLLHGGLRQTVDPGHETSVRGCLRPLHIARRVGEILQIRNGTGLFAGGQMAEEDMDALMLAVQEAYVEAKRRNRKKYAPKKNRSAE